MLGDDLAEVQGKRRDEVGRVRDLQRHLDGVCIDRAGGSLRVIRADCRQRHHAWRLGVRIHHAVQAVDHVLGGDWLAVVPLGLRIEVEGIGFAVLAELPACRQVAPYVGGILGLGVELDELIVDPRIADDLHGVRAVGMPVGRRERVGMHGDDAAVLGRAVILGLPNSGVGAHQCTRCSTAQRRAQHQPSRRMFHRRLLPV